MPKPNLLLIRALTAIAPVLMYTGEVSAQGTETADIQENRPVGTWTDYLPYHQTEELIHCGTYLDTGFWAVRTEHAVFTLDERTDVVERISTVRGMSGSQPTALAWDPTGEMLIVGQASGSIDFFSNTGNCATSNKATSSATSPSSAWKFLVRSTRTSSSPPPPLASLPSTCANSMFEIPGTWKANNHCGVAMGLWSTTVAISSGPTAVSLRPLSITPS